MIRVIKPLAVLLIIGAAGLLVWKFVLPPPEPEGRPTPAPPAGGPSLPANATNRIERAADLVAMDVYRRLWEDNSSLNARNQLSRAIKARGTTAAETLERRMEELLSTFRYRSAIGLAEQYKLAWEGHDLARLAADLVGELRTEQAEQIQGRWEEALALVDAARYDAAREALRTNWELESRFTDALAEHTESLERRIRVHQYGAVPKPGPPERGPEIVPTLRTEPSMPPALPGFPHPDVKRLRDAKTLLAKARRLFDNRRHATAAEELTNVRGYYGDLQYVKRRADGIEALNTLARHGAQGLSGLFRATSVKRKGRHVRLHYTFANANEHLDWEETQIFPAQEGGEFRPARGGVRGTGIAAYLLHGFFEDNVKISCSAKIQQARSHGLLFCQDDLETRFLMWMLQNHYFVEGENYVKVRPGHSILMFGKGVNNDVPVDSPEIGFIFRGPSITKPELGAGAEAKIGFTYKGTTMKGEIKYRGKSGGLSGSTIGDDGNGIERTRPGLFVIENGVLFRDIVVEGRLHTDFERRRIDALLDLVATLD